MPSAKLSEETFLIYQFI